jgi:alkaline phosphatase D
LRVRVDGSTVSHVGQTKTAPGPNDETDSLVYAFFSCSHFRNGYFHPYDVASTISDLDFWIHVGDYVVIIFPAWNLGLSASNSNFPPAVFARLQYEYGTYSTYAADAASTRGDILPPWEQISLQDHRNRMATYHTDIALQNLR